MDRAPHDPLHPAAWIPLAIALAGASLGAAGVAATHLWQTAQRGVICGAAFTASDHCWACYAAPLLALAAVVAASRPRLGAILARSA